jgi:N-acetylmuramoyl-L-alanine amidase
MRAINKIIVHSTGTPAGVPVTVESIERQHKANGWGGIGYHYVIYFDGSVHIGRPIEQPGVHTIGHNADSIAVNYVGGAADATMKKGADTRTPAQKTALLTLLKKLKLQFPNAKIYGHKDFNATACPGFDAKNEYKNL